MKLICRKCQEEIDLHKIEHFKDGGLWQYKIEVECHGETDAAGQYSSPYEETLHFFEKDGCGRCDHWRNKEGIEPYPYCLDCGKSFEKKEAKEKTICFGNPELDSWWENIAQEAWKRLEEWPLETYVKLSAEKVVNQLLEDWKENAKEVFDGYLRDLKEKDEPLKDCVRFCGWIHDQSNEIGELKKEITLLRDKLRCLCRDNSTMEDEIDGLKEKLSSAVKGCKDCELLKKKDARIEQEKSKVLKHLESRLGLLDEITQWEEKAIEDGNTIGCLNLALKGVPAPLTWSKDKPTEAGFWFWRPEGEVRTIIWRVYRIFPVSQINPIVEGEKTEFRGFVAITGKDKFKYVDVMDGEWAGPIPEPGEKVSIGEMDEDPGETFDKAMKVYREYLRGQRVLKEICGNCGYWKGEVSDTIRNKKARKCEHFDALAGFFTYDYSCSGWKPDNG